VSSTRPFTARAGGASIEEIAQRAEITKPVIYHHFASKQELHAAVFEHYSAQLLDASDSYGQSGSHRQRFQDLLAGMFSFAHEKPHVWQLLLGTRMTPRPHVCNSNYALPVRVMPRCACWQPNFQPGTTLSRRKAAEVIAQLTRSAVDGLVSWSLEHPEVPRAALIETASELLWTGLARTTTVLDVSPYEDKESSGQRAAANDRGRETGSSR
jgi:AcrR family transcriptional regulator